MSRITHAAKQLLNEVGAQRKTAKHTREGDADGLGVVRTIKFDKATSKWLYPILEASADDRIESLDLSKDQLSVTFVSGPKADKRDPFRLVEVESVLDS